MAFDPNLEQKMMQSAAESESNGTHTLQLNGVTFESNLPMNIPGNPLVGSLVENQEVRVTNVEYKNRTYTLAFAPDGINIEDAISTIGLVPETTFSFDTPGIFSVTWY